jgi:pimeloyl-ACP methyl ester carboxylesterase
MHALSAPWFRLPLAFALVALLSACLNTGDSRRPIPTETFVGSASRGEILVVVLPGRWDDVPVMSESGIARAIGEAWPEADVLLAGATLAYYLDGGLAPRLHTEVIAPARERGYRQIWLAGASMGGMGTLLYERQFPGELDGLVLLAPFLGDRGLFREIMAAGGVAGWDPGPEPAQVNRDNYQRELWRYLKTWTERPELGRRAWIAYGDQDRLRQAVPVFSPLLPPAQVLERPGGHKWEVWVPAAAEVFTAVRAQNLASK